MNSLLTRVALTVLLASIAAGGCAGTKAADDSVAIHTGPGGRYAAIDFQGIIEGAKAKVFPTLVYVRPIREDYSEGKKKRVVVGGSGVIISEDGYVVTNHHVAEKAIEIRCVLFDNSMMQAELVGLDQDTDLALLKLKPEDPATKFPYARLADSDRVQEGEFVMALGAPWGLKRSISLGIISSAQRYLEGASEYSLWLQSDAALNPGNSGGPLVNTEGQVIGINTLGSMMGGDMGFSIPSNTVRHVVEQLKAGGKVNRSWTGLRLQPLRDFDRDSFFEGQRGVLVASVDPGSPAEQAGLQAGDLIVAVNGQPTNGLYNEDLPAVRSMLGRLPLGEAAQFSIERGGAPVAVAVTLGEKGRVEGEDLGLKRWDMTVKAINKHFNPDLYYYVKEGVYVQGVRYPGNAAAAGFQGHEIVVKVDNKPVKSLSELEAIYNEIMSDAGRKKRVLFEVMRNGIPALVVVDYDRDYDKP